MADPRFPLLEVAYEKDHRAPAIESGQVKKLHIFHIASVELCIGDSNFSFMPHHFQMLSGDAGSTDAHSHPRSPLG